MADFMEEAWLTPEEVANYFHVHRNSIYRLVERDEITFLRVGRMIRISKSMLKKYIDQGGSPLE